MTDNKKDRHFKDEKTRYFDAMTKKDLFFVAYNKEKKWFQVVRAQKCCRQNLEVYAQETERGMNLDFIPVGIFDDEKTAQDFCDRVENMHEAENMLADIWDS